MEPHLENCPFCGGDNIRGSVSGAVVGYACQECGGGIRFVCYAGTPSGMLDLALKRWNTRTPAKEAKP